LFKRVAIEFAPLILMQNVVLFEDVVMEEKKKKTVKNSAPSNKKEISHDVRIDSFSAISGSIIQIL
jgi:hypothetical protein